LNLSNNRLCGVWVEYGTRKGNYITEGINAIADALRVNGALTSLELRGNQLGDKGWGAIFAAICGNKDSKITSLDASSENIGPVGGNAVAAMVAVTGALTALDLSLNDLHDDGVSAVCEAIQSNKETKLVSLNMGANSIGPVGAKSVAAMAAVTGGLTALDLSSNDLKDEGVCAVCKAIQSNKETKLASLNFKNNSISPGGANALAAMVAVTGVLTMLSLARNRLGEEGTKAICEALEQNKSLKEIDISGAGNHTGIGGSAGAKHVANMLGVNGSLTSVKLRGNTLGDEGWGAIFAAICGNKDSKIMSMDASDENIGPVGVKLIAESLRTSVTGALTSINLSKNRLTNFGGDMTGIKELAAALGVNGGLTALDLSFNNLNDDSVSAVCEAIQSNKETKLASLNMGANSIGPVGAKSVAAMVAVTGTLMECDVSNNAMGEEGKASIRFVAQGKAGFNLHL